MSYENGIGLEIASHIVQTQNAIYGCEEVR